MTIRQIIPWSLKIAIILSVFFWVIGYRSCSAEAQTLSPKAEKAFEKGKIAMKKEAWGSALRYFEEARRHSPGSPGVLYALGVSHRQAGHPVIASVFLKAYLEALPDAPNAESVQKTIQEIEVFNDQLVKDLFKEAMTAVEALSDDGYRKGAAKKVIKSMAESGELFLVRDYGLKHPSGVPGILSDLAVGITDNMRRGKAVRVKPSPADLFDIAKELISAAAEDFDPVRLPLMPCAKHANPTNAHLRVYKECLQNLEQKLRQWEGQRQNRRLLYKGAFEVGLGLGLYKAGFHKRAYDTIKNGAELVERSWLFGGGIPVDPAYGKPLDWCLYTHGHGFTSLRMNWGCAFMDHKGTAVKVAENGNVWLRSTEDNYPEREKIPFVSWLDIINKGRAPEPWDFKLNDSAFLHFISLIENIKGKPAQEIPSELSELAAKHARVSQLLQSH